MKFTKCIMLALLMIGFVAIVTPGCSTIQGLIGAEQTQTFDQQAEAINTQAIADYNNSKITIFQRDAVRSLLCDYQTAHNKKVEAGATTTELQADFTAMQQKVAEIYKGGK